MFQSGLFGTFYVGHGRPLSWSDGGWKLELPRAVRSNRVLGLELEWIDWDGDGGDDQGIVGVFII